MDCFFVGRLRGAKRPIWQLTATDSATSYAWAELVVCPGQSDPAQTSSSPVASPKHRKSRLEAGTHAHRQWQRIPGQIPRSSTAAASATPASSRPSPDQRPRRTLHKTILDECWRPSFARYHHLRYNGLRQELDNYLDHYNTDRAHNGRHAQGRVPADIVYRAQKMELR